MEILSRQDAVTKRVTRYFTGKPCLRGHITERYTKTGSCIECLHPKFEAVDDRRNSKTKLPDIRNTTKQLVKVKLVIATKDYDTFVSYILALCQTVEPRLEQRHIVTSVAPEHCPGSMMLYTIKTLPQFKMQLLTELSH